MAMYSHSKISSFKQCPKKYEFAYIRRVPKESRSIETYMGSCAHDALEWVYTQVGMGKVPDVADALARYRETWDGDWDPCVKVVRKGYTALDYKLLGEKMVRGYYERHHPFDADTTIGLEQRIVLALDADRSIQGFVDRLVKVRDGVWEIHDYKTSRNLPTQAEADEDRQLATYELAVREMYEEPSAITLVWHYLLHDCEVRSQRTPEQLDSLRDSLLADIGVIESAEDFPTKVTKLCDWCEYRSICPAWSHEASLEALPEAEIATHDDAQLVERYAEVCQQARELGAEKDALRAEILHRMHEQELDALAGSAHRIRRSARSCVRIPAAGDTARRELEVLLQEAGVWSRCSTVSANDLGELLQDPETPEDLRREIERYVTMDEAESIRVSLREG